YGSLWIRWQAEIPTERILENLETLYAEQWKEKYSDENVLTESAADIAVMSRSENGQVQTLAVTVGIGTIEIEGEYAVRQLLAPDDTEVVLMDGSTVSGMQLLPSAFFYIDGSTSDRESVCIYGGGYGHGNGMSQYGAAQMAADGASWLEILEYYFGNNGQGE
ncbi:MAG: hypothetical protein LUG56_03600, partial [Lachnospiraceae bacterium]|nr:hypothetical protein [Lachnospiraceae bacterium]